MKTKQHRQSDNSHTTLEANVLKSLVELRNGLHGATSRDYLDRYIQLKAQAFRLEAKGLKVRIELPDFPRRPLLVIEK